MSASFLDWPGILLGEGMWRRDCGMGPGGGSVGFVFAPLTRKWEEASLTLIQSGEDLTKRNVRVTCTCGKGSGVVRGVFREGIREEGLVT